MEMGNVRDDAIRSREVAAHLTDSAMELFDNSEKLKVEVAEFVNRIRAA